MVSQICPALVSLLLLTLLTGIAYPLVVTGVAQVVFPLQANGSLILRDGHAVGSKLIGQAFDDPMYFWGRLSATGTFAYNAFNAENLTASSGSNYGPLNPALVDAVQARIDALKAADPGNAAPIPVDLVTASGSGLDPISARRRPRIRLPRRAGAWSQRGCRPSAGRPIHAGPAVRFPGRADRQRPGAESGTGRGPVRTCLDRSYCRDCQRLKIGSGEAIYARSTPRPAISDEHFPPQWEMDPRIFGVGGVIAPFIGNRLIDMLLVGLHLV